MKIIALIVSLSLLTGCSFFPVREKIIEIERPILYCPAPKWEELNSPYPLAIEGITRTTSAGEVAQRYNASIVQLRDYSERLVIMLEEYDKTNKAYEQLRQEFLKNSVVTP